MVNTIDTTSVSLAGPDDRFGELFIAVQTSGLFSDSKTFVDAIPLNSDKQILASYQLGKNQPGFRLSDFVAENFAVPLDSPTHFITDPSKTAAEHITILWDVLTRQPGTVTDTGTLIPIPKPYVVPGGRFREIYYWDSYFTMLGLAASDRWDLIENMVDNFSYLIDTLGFIPNGNRTYYLSRSQPPFYSLMVKLLAQKQGEAVLEKYMAQLQKEYDFWMDGAAELTHEKPAYRRVVLLPDGVIMNRYWDDRATPRPESYIEDIELVKAHHLPVERYRDIRAAAESGWDFSGRWFKDHGNMSSIHTTEIIPIDLNALLYHHEMVLAEAYLRAGNTALHKKYLVLAQQRQQAMQRYMWDDRDGFFHDYDFISKRPTHNKSLAAMFPLYFMMAESHQAERVAHTIEHEFLKPGGVSTTLNNTHQQWDAPNGWAPLHWITIKGLQNYQQHKLAATIQERWVNVNLRVYKNTGKMVEKYNVYDLELTAGGGEYPVQDGFGWTNGVLLTLLDK
ncbi:alpha,alpha-trehalase TreA [Cellvibrio mixtus]|uniref:alpha,alpha-trehalase TreA n=1 Tax=Cellvibrio mixtus TaxID=39650 RepID=UPI000A8223C9|nr:alpha,alpha-trehalase TreA [Cellvibrio mixtus]